MDKGQKKPYNPNTTYGRRKLREQSQEYYNNLPDDKKENFDNVKFIIVVIIIGIVLLYVFLTGDTKSASKWISH